MSQKRIEREVVRWESAAKYDAEQGEFAHIFKAVADWVIENVNVDDEVVEAGCGNGMIALPVAPHVKRLRGFDISQSMLAAGNQQAESQGIENVSFDYGDAYNLNMLANDSVDVVVCSYLFDVVERPSRILKEVHRILKPGGLILSATDIMTWELSFKGMIKRRFMRALGKTMTPSYNELISLHERAGFKVREARRLPVQDEYENLLVCGVTH